MRRLWLRLVLACLVALGPPAMAATNPDEILADPVLEQRARDLAKELRCLVCQNQSIDDSDADLARDLRRIVREQLVAGRSDGEIVDYLTARYGDFVLLKPPVKPATWGLWFGPVLVLVIAATGVVVYVRRRRGGEDAPPAPLSVEERGRLFAARFVDGSPSTVANIGVSLDGPVWLRVGRAGDGWSFDYSVDGVSWQTGASFSHALSVSQAGVFVGNTGSSPAHTAVVDYVFDTAAPISDEDADTVTCP